MSTATDYDYTAQTAEDEADSFQMGGATATKSAEQIEKEAAAKEFRDIEPGEHVLRVIGFWGKPEPKERSAYVNGQPRKYTAYSVGVKFAKASEPQAQITDYFDLPPYEPFELEAFLYGSKKADGKNAGFFAGKLFQFLGRLNPDWHIEPGQSLPEDATLLGNWKGRQVIATIEAGRVQKDQNGTPLLDANTGLPKVPRNQVKLFSYRAAGDVASAAANTPAPSRPQAGTPQASRPQQARPTGQPVAAQMERPGLRRSI